MKVGMRVNRRRGTVTFIGTEYARLDAEVDIQVLGPDLLESLRAGKEPDYMLGMKKCKAFAEELEALLDKNGIERYWTEYLT